MKVFLLNSNERYSVIYIVNLKVNGNINDQVINEDDVNRMLRLQLYWGAGVRVAKLRGVSIALRGAPLKLHIT